jgi:hypothetical protein
MTLILQGTDNSVSSPAVQGGTAGTTTGVYYPAANQVAIATNGTQAMLANSVQGVQFANAIGVGATTPTTSGAGITFPATQSASTNANTLDDYEEGTWTPIYVQSVSNPTVAYTGVIGIYRKIGSFVWVGGRIATTSVAGGSGDIYIGGLPFTVATNGNDYGSLNIGVSFGSWPTNGYPAAGYPTQSSTQIVLATYNGADARNGLDIRLSSFSAGGSNGMVFSACYYTA